MGEPIFAMIVPLGGSGPIDPGFGNLGGIGGPHPGNRPIYHPGHPSHGLPVGPEHIGGGPIYHPGHPSHGLPSGGHIDNALPPGGTDIPSNELPMPELPAEYADNLIVAVRKPNETDWTMKAYDDVTPGQGLPPTPGTPTTPIAPTPAPKRR